MRIKSDDFYKEYYIDNKIEKVVPRMSGYDYLKHRYAIYVYLDPFIPENRTVEFKCCGKNYKYKFYYQPFYIGKLENPIQYRFNHHWNNFLKGIQDVVNKYKAQKLREIEEKIKKGIKVDNLTPSSMDEYKHNWIIILKVFDNPADLRKFEESIIKAIGILRDNSGPLTNFKKGN